MSDYIPYSKPEDLNEIKQFVSVEFDMGGIGASTKQIAYFSEQLKKAIGSNENLSSSIEKSSKFIRNEIVRWAHVHKEELKEVKKKNDQASESFKNLENAVKRFAQNTAKGFRDVFTGGNLLTDMIGGQAQSLKEYNENILKSASLMKRYGVGIQQLESSFNSMTRTLNITKSELLGLHHRYEEVFDITRLHGFERMLKNISKISGPNAQEMGAYFSSLSSVVKELPSLQKHLENVTDDNKEFIQSQLNLLRVTGKLDSASYKHLTRYVSQLNYATEGDVRRQRQIKRNLETMQKFKQHQERVAILLTKAVMPAFEKFANFLDNNSGLIERLFNNAASAMEGTIGVLDKLTYKFDKLFGGIKKGQNEIRGQGGTSGSNEFDTGTVSNQIGLGIGAMSLVGGLPLIAGGIKGAGVWGAKKARGTRIGRRTRVLIGRNPILKGMSSGIGRAGVGGGIMVAGMGAEALSDWMGKGKDKETQGGWGLLGDVASVGSSAAGGALIGSAVGPVGAAIGGVAGALWGLYKKWDEMADNTSKFLGYQNTTRTSERRSILEEELRQKRKEIESKVLQAKEERGTKDGNEDQITKIRREAFAGIHQADSKYLTDMTNKKTKLQEKLKEEIEMFEAHHKAYSPKKDAMIKDAETKIEVTSGLMAHAEKELNEAKAKGDKEYQDILIKDIKKYVKELEEAQKVITDINDERKDAMFSEDAKNIRDLKKELENVEIGIIEAYQAYDRFLKLKTQLDSFVGSVRELTQAEVELMNITGNLSSDEITSKILKQNSAYDKQINTINKLLPILKNANQVSIEATAKTMSKQDREEFLEVTKRMGVSQDDMSRMMGEEAVNKMLAEREKIYSQMTSSLDLVNSQYQQERDLLSQTSSLAQNYVSYMDSVATGLGASVEARNKVFNLTEKELDLLQRQKMSLDAAYKKEMERIQGEKDKAKIMENAAEKQMRLESLRIQGIAEERKHRQLTLGIENEILGKTQQQAQLTRSLNDGWIDSIRYMNMGTSRFSKIMVGHNKNMQAMVDTLGGTISSRTGSGRKSGLNRDTGPAQFGLGGLSNMTYHPDYISESIPLNMQVKHIQNVQRYRDFGEGAMSTEHMRGLSRNAMVGGGVAQVIGTRPDIRMEPFSEAIKNGEVKVTNKALNSVANNTAAMARELGATVTAGDTYEKGGIINGPSHAQGGMKFFGKGGPIELEGGEMVIPKKEVKDFITGNQSNYSDKKSFAEQILYKNRYQLRDGNRRDFEKIVNIDIIKNRSASKKNNIFSQINYLSKFGEKASSLNMKEIKDRTSNYISQFHEYLKIQKGFNLYSQSYSTSKNNLNKIKNKKEKIHTSWILDENMKWNAYNYYNKVHNMQKNNPDNWYLRTSNMPLKEYEYKNYSILYKTLYENAKKLAEKVEPSTSQRQKIVGNLYNGNIIDGKQKKSFVEKKYSFPEKTKYSLLDAISKVEKSREPLSVKYIEDSIKMENFVFSNKKTTSSDPLKNVKINYDKWKIAAEKFGAGKITLDQYSIALSNLKHARNKAGLIGDIGDAFYKGKRPEGYKSQTRFMKNGGFLEGPSHAEGGMTFKVGGKMGGAFNYELEGGEYVVNKESTQKHRADLERINNGNYRANGGPIGNTVSSNGGIMINMPLSIKFENLSSLGYQVEKALKQFLNENDNVMTIFSGGNSINGVQTSRY